MVFLVKIVLAIELLKHTNNQRGIVQLQNLRIRVATPSIGGILPPVGGRMPPIR